MDGVVCVVIRGVMCGVAVGVGGVVVVGSCPSGSGVGSVGVSGVICGVVADGVGIAAVCVVTVGVG